MKFISGIVAFIITFVLSVSVVGLIFGFPKVESSQNYYGFTNTNSVVKNRIESLIRKDVRNGNNRDRAIRRIDNYYNMSSADLYSNEVYRSELSKYVVKSSSINDAGLPDDFKYAWREHMNAWQKQNAYLNSVESNVDSNYSNYADNTEEINSTWYQVLRIAQRYGVEIHPSYYN